jgi:lipopolysaccharide transport system ATP-binding protein
MHAATTSRAGSERATDNAAIEVSNAGVRFRFLTERERTLKGRLLNLLDRRDQTERDFWALRDVSFKARQGEVVGIIGPNGAGKSTLLKLVARVLPPSQGAVAVTGQVHALLDFGGTLNPELSGRENCYVYAALQRIPRARMQQLIPQIADFAELGAFFDVPVKCYSSGMSARLAFATATQIKPEILLIDEVLSVGDEHFQKKSYFRMLKLIEKGSLVVLVSHNLTFVEQVCTRCVLLANGEVIASGAPRQLIAQYRNGYT